MNNNNIRVTELYITHLYIMNIQIAIRNSVIGDIILSKEFRKNKDSKKYVDLWVSKAYRYVNLIMRNKTFEEQSINYPITIHYIYKLIKYILKHGKTATEIQNTTDKLYRGITEDYAINNNYIDNGFMSTTLSKTVANKFSEKNGNIIRFKTKDLPENTKYLIIKGSEKEILFLPGSIEIVNNKNNRICKYKMNEELVNKYKLLKKIVGGFEDQIPDIDLSDKLVVWHRAIKNRPVEIIGQTFLVKNQERVITQMKAVLRSDDRFHRVTNLMPEYQDTKDKTYNIHMAIFDYKNNKVLTLYYGMIDEMIRGFADQSRDEEIIEFIKNKYKWLIN